MIIKAWFLFFVSIIQSMLATIFLFTIVYELTYEPLFAFGVMIISAWVSSYLGVLIFHYEIQSYLTKKAANAS